MKLLNLLRHNLYWKEEQKTKTCLKFRWEKSEFMRE